METRPQQRWQEHSPALMQVHLSSLNRLLQYFKLDDHRRLSSSIRPTLHAQNLHANAQARYKALHSQIPLMSDSAYCKQLSEADHEQPSSVRQFCLVAWLHESPCSNLTYESISGWVQTFSRAEGNVRSLFWVLKYKGSLTCRNNTQFK